MNNKIFTFLFLISLFLANCAWAGFSDSDLNQDGIVNYLDLYALMDFWLNDCYQKPCYNVDIKDNGFIDFSDFTDFSRYWKLSDSNSYQVAYWPMDESSGTVIKDVTLNDHNAVMTNMTSSDHVAGKRGNALDFDGSDDLLVIDTLNNGMGQHFTRDFSIAAWVYQKIPRPQYQTIIGIESTSAYTNYGFEGFTIEVDDGVPVMYIAYSDTQRETVFATVPFTSNQWQHLCIVRQGSILKIYIDGKLDTYQTITDANIKFGSAYPGYDSIGATYDSSSNPSPQAYFKGKLDEIHLYNFAIPESLVHKLAQQDYAWLPAPANNVGNISVDSNLCWQKGAWAGSVNCHDVYLGTNYNNVNAADTNTAGIYKGRQTSRLFDPCVLDANVSYYWRIDDVNGTQKHKGSVWSFETIDLRSPFTASSSQSGYGPVGASDGNRFEASTGQCWKGMPGEGNWFWQMNFTEPRQIGSVLMIMGEPGTAGEELEFYQNNAPLNYKWRYSDDGLTWYDVNGTQVQNEKRMFRIQRFNNAITAKHFRLEISGCVGSYPTIREIELYSTTNANIPFGSWIVPIDITNERGAPYGNTSWFVGVARRCSGWSNVQAQQLWVADFNEAFLNIEPYPLCVFVSGSFDEWCQVTRSYFTGLQEVLVNGHIPMWGSCGGAQVFGLLLDPGCENPWDCPRCRHYHSPAWSPIYGHIGYIDPAIEPQACGNYSNCISEVDGCRIAQVGSDPVFAGLSNPFRVYEHHVGEIEYLPPGWQLIGNNGQSTNGNGTYSETYTHYQCFRRTDRYIYGAQFHIENDYSTETNNNAKIIMGNFLNLAVGWGGYNPP
ncbi:MAG: LamG-like jellyroll fold domain-containing protein [Sedimentisphaerales bacterium]